VPSDGEQLPTLTAVFARVAQLNGGGGVRFSIETKLAPNKPEETVDPETFVRALLAVIRDAGVATRAQIQSFDWRTLAVVQRLASGIPTVYLTTEGGNADNLTPDGAWTNGLLLKDHRSVGHMVKAAGGAVWSPNHRNLTQGDLNTARQLGLKVVPWTVNDMADADRLIAWGVDGLITDDPDRLREVMQRRGLPLPPPVAVPAR